MVCASSSTITLRARLCSLRHHDRRGPILHGEPQLVGAFLRAEMFFLNRRMMLKYDIVAQDFAEDRSCLIDHGCEGYGGNDPFESVVLGVVESKSERGKCLTAAGRHCEREEPLGVASAAADMSEDIRAKAVHVSGCCGLALL